VLVVLGAGAVSRALAGTPAHRQGLRGRLYQSPSGDAISRWCGVAFACCRGDRASTPARACSSCRSRWCSCSCELRYDRSRSVYGRLTSPLGSEQMVREALIRWSRAFVDRLERTLPYAELRSKRCKHAVVVCRSPRPCAMVCGERELGRAGRVS